jgi:predicted transcriptional regulator
MAQINIVTTEEEREKVIEALKKINGEIAPVSKIATMAGLKHSRARYVIIDLIEAGRILRVPHRAFNKRYIRYSYKVL